MRNIPYLVFVVGLVVVFLGVLIAVKAKKHKHKPDYYTFFILGIAWIPIGVATDNALFSIVGLVFAIIGLIHKKEWKKNYKALGQLSEGQRRLLYGLIIAVTVILTLSVLLLAVLS